MQIALEKTNFSLENVVSLQTKFWETKDKWRLSLPEGNQGLSPSRSIKSGCVQVTLDWTKQLNPWDFDVK